MSYNIDTYKIKKLKDFSFPVSALFESDRSDWHPHIEYGPNNSASFYAGEGEIKGKIIDNNFHVTDFEVYGEGSGTFMDLILEPALKKSKGTLEASFVWEGGDSINKIRVNNGNVEWEDIEI